MSIYSFKIKWGNANGIEIVSIYMHYMPNKFIEREVSYNRVVEKNCIEILLYIEISLTNYPTVKLKIWFSIPMKC